MSIAIDLNYFIKPSYRARPEPQYFTDKVRNDQRRIVWQPEVYEWAKKLGSQLGCSRAIDLGCGNGEKLAALYPEYQIVGVDYGPNLDHCRAKYGFGTWLEADFEAGDAVEVRLPAVQQRESVVICSDVIEHLKNPLPLLRGMRKLLDEAPLAVLSTPERNLLHGMKHQGPPVNPCHVREWSLRELRRLLEHCGFQIIFCGQTRSNDQEQLRYTCFFLLARPGLRLNLTKLPEPSSPVEYWTEVLANTAKKALGR